MAISLRIPNSGSQTTVAGAIPSSCGNDVWLGLVTGPTSSGCVTFFKGSAEAAGCILFSMTTGCFGTVLAPFPVNISEGLYAACISGGSVIYAVGR